MAFAICRSCLRGLQKDITKVEICATGITSNSFSTTNQNNEKKSYKLLIVGGGTAGSAIANKFTSKLGKGNVAVIEPQTEHYYQPMFTLVGGGIKDFEQTHSPVSDVLPKNCDWIQDRAASFDPDNCEVTTEKGTTVKYDYLLVSMGLSLDYDKVDGLVDALQSDPKVCSNYSPKYVNKTNPAIKNFIKNKGGNAVFTFPNTPIKCAGAPQKICYLAEEQFRNAGIRDKTNIYYNTSLPVIFGVPRYAKVLNEIVKERGINMNTRHNLIKVDPSKSEAVFELLDKPGETVTFQYDMLHATPPMSSSKPLHGSKLVDSTNYVDVNRETMQHTKYPNIFAMGDCTNAPTAKTAAAVAGQTGVVSTNLQLVMRGDQPVRKYDGYTSCPLLTSSSTCVLAEFGYDGSILETFPFNQAKERKTMFILKAQIMPIMYWNMLLRGWWHGPSFIRKVMSLGAKA